MMENSNWEYTWKEKKCPGLKAFPHDDLMKEHSVGFSLKKPGGFHRSIRRRTLQALTALSGGIHSSFFLMNVASIRVAPREFNSRPLFNDC
jgi:hypothetical protein